MVDLPESNNLELMDLLDLMPVWINLRMISALLILVQAVSIVPQEQCQINQSQV